MKIDWDFVITVVVTFGTILAPAIVGRGYMQDWAHLERCRIHVSGCP